MAKGSKQGEKGPGKKNQKNQKKKSKNEESQFEANDDKGNLESCQPDIWGQEGTINAMGMVEKLKKLKGSSNRLIMRNYNYVFNLSILQITMTLYSGLEPIQILEFIGFEYERFLEILLLMLEDELPIVSLDVNMINYSNSLIMQEVSRSVSFGMRKLREKRQIKDLNTPIDLDEIDIKCLYVSHLLLIGVGEISPKTKSKEKGQTTMHHFHRIVTHLLKRNNFLPPKLFYLIQKKWSKIMDIVYTQIEQDEEERLAQEVEKQKKQNQKISTPINKTLGRGDMQTAEKRQKKTGSKQFANESDNLMSDQDYQMMVLGHEEYSSYLKDMTSNDVDESRYFRCEKMKDIQTEEQRKQRIFGNVEEEMQQYEGEAQHQEEQTANDDNNKIIMKQQCENYQANQIAKQEYNYLKYYTVNRNPKSKKIQKESKNKTKNEQEKKPITKSDSKLKQKNISSECSSSNQEILMLNAYEDGFYMQDEEIDFYGRKGIYCDNDSMEEICNQQYEEDSSKELPSETLQSSGRVEMINEFQTMQLQSHMFQVPTHEVQTQNAANPNRAVRHERREIDYLVSMVLSNREELIETIANHIYFELAVWNVRLRR